MAQRPTRAERYIAKQKQVPAFRRAHTDATRRIRQVDDLVRALDEAREEQGMTKAELARRAGVAPEAVRRMFSASGVNPTATTLVALADALGLEVVARRRTLALRSRTDSPGRFVRHLRAGAPGLRAEECQREICDTCLGRRPPTPVRSPTTSSDRRPAVTTAPGLDDLRVDVARSFASIASTLVGGLDDEVDVGRRHEYEGARRAPLRWASVCTESPTSASNAAPRNEPSLGITMSGAAPAMSRVADIRRSRVASAGSAR